MVGTAMTMVTVTGAVRVLPLQKPALLPWPLSWPDTVPARGLAL